MSYFFFNINGTRSITFDLYNKDIMKLRKGWQRMVKQIPLYPGNYKGKGIVICAGGISYFTCAWLLIKSIRKCGCTLPIEFWYYDNEISIEIKDILEADGIECRDISTYFDKKDTPGYIFKPLSILNSRFEEVLYLDSDNYCTINPEFLFECQQYKDFGAIFWPDYWQTSEENPIWKILNVPYINMKEQESGQIVINKKQCWKELNLCIYFNRLHGVYYKLLLGDKDTFRFAWLALNKVFYFITTEPSSCGYYDRSDLFRGTTMVQHCPDGSICFLHRNLLKWDVTRENDSTWMAIKAFKRGANEKFYIIGKSDNGHFYMDLDGDTNEVAFNDVLGHLEQTAFNDLEELRSSEFYRRYLLYSYINTNRFNNSRI